MDSRRENRTTNQEDGCIQVVVVAVVVEERKREGRALPPVRPEVQEGSAGNNNFFTHFDHIITTNYIL